jgi:CRP-like cAMP-binding protein
VYQNFPQNFLRTVRRGAHTDSPAPRMDGPAPHTDGRAPLVDLATPGGTEAPGPQATESNRLLHALSPEVYDRLLPDFETIECAVGQVLWQPDTPIRSVFFPRSAVGSILTPLVRDAPVEAATVGHEGMIGIPIVLGVRTSAALAVTQIRGEALRMDSERFREHLAHENGALSTVLLRYAQALQEQTAQTVACNRRHEMEERCARWLLMTADRVGADQFLLTHEFLAAMLGVRRASVTVAAGMLQQAGLIRYSRGKITIVDRPRLEAASCECYRTVRDRYARTVGTPGM